MAYLDNNLKDVVCKAIDASTEELQNISKDIWKHPELNYQEHYSHKVLTDYLERKGYEVERKFVVDTGFKAEIGSNEIGPNIAVICEYDALPEIGHACGHNLIAEAGVAAAVGLIAAFKDLKAPLGKVTVLGTPAEEGGGGKIDMIEAGVFQDIDAAMMVHPYPTTASHTSSTAVGMVTVQYEGKAAHAAAYPWEGVNALDAAVLCYQNVSCLRQQIKPTWRIHGIIRNGGLKPSIIPDFTELEYYFRTTDKSELDALKVKLKACIKSAATATGCEVKIEFSEKPYWNLVTNFKMADAFRNHAESVGVRFDRREEISGGSTDMGNVSQIVPSIHPLYGIETTAVNHTKEFAKAAGDPKAQSYTLAQGKAMALTVLDILTNDCLLREIKEEFDEFKRSQND